MQTSQTDSFGEVSDSVNIPCYEIRGTARKIRREDVQQDSNCQAAIASSGNEDIVSQDI
jgi:hypothetical protein